MDLYSTYLWVQYGKNITNINVSFPTIYCSIHILCNHRSLSNTTGMLFFSSYIFFTKNQTNLECYILFSIDFQNTHLSRQRLYIIRVSREYWIIYRGTGFLAVVWFGSLPTPSPPLLSVTSTGAHRKTEKKRQLADRRGWRGWERSHITRRR